MADDGVTGSRHKEWLTDILESAPSIIFLALWRSDVDMELAGWIGVALAAATLIGLRLFRIPYNPILLGINVHLVVITPLIVTAYGLGSAEFARALVAGSERSVLVTVFVVGCALTAFSRRGFVGQDNLPATSRWIYSSILLAALAAAIVWSFYLRGRYAAGGRSAHDGSVRTASPDRRALAGSYPPGRQRQQGDSCRFRLGGQFQKRRLLNAAHGRTSSSFLYMQTTRTRPPGAFSLWQVTLRGRSSAICGRMRPGSRRGASTLGGLVSATAGSGGFG